MCDAIAQCVESMIPVGVSRQPDKSHVSHAAIEGVQGCYSGTIGVRHDGQRCALLTTKSRNACTRATDFSSSGYTK